MDETEEEKRKNSRLVTTVIGSLIAMAVFSMVRDFPVATAPGASEEIRAYEAKIREFQDAEDRLIDLEGEYLSKEGEQTLAALRAEVARLKAAIPSTPPEGYAAFLLKEGPPEQRRDAGVRFFAAICFVLLSIGTLQMNWKRRAPSSIAETPGARPSAAPNSSAWWAWFKDRQPPGTPQRRYAARQESDAAIREMKDAQKTEQK